MEKNIKKILLNEFVCLVLQVIFSKITILKVVCPFGLPFAITRVVFGGNIFFVIFSYLISKVPSFLIFPDIFACFYEIVIICLFYYLISLKDIKRPLLTLEISVVTSSALKLYYMLTFSQNLLLYLLDLASLMLITAYFYKFFSIYKNKFLFFKFSNLDYLYFSLFALFITFGLYLFELNALYLEYFFISLAVIFSCRVLPTDKFFVFIISIGLGAALASGNASFLIYAAVSSILLINFKNRNKFLYAALHLLAVASLFIIVPSFNLYSILFAAISSLVFVCFKSNIMNKISELFEIDSINLMCEDLRKEKFSRIKTKLGLMSNTLKNMQRDFKFLLVGKISREKACTELSQDIINSCCKKCENFRTCFLENINKRLMLENLLNKAIENGKVSRDDVILGLQTYCTKENIIVSEINQVAESFLKFEKTMKTEDSSKLMIADNLGNFSDIFLQFSKFIDTDLGYNKPHSNLLKENLTNSMIDVKEVVILENSQGIESINLIAQNEHILKSELIKNINSFARNKFKINIVRHLNLSGLSYASFVPCEKLKMNFAVASKAKDSCNGDNVAITKLSQNKYFIAIADGMGHGENANRISSMILSLIRSMFEIGFNDSLIIESINKLLIPVLLDGFSTLDACVVDLANECCTFIKMGSSVSVLKHQNTSDIISCASLPIGVVDNVKPTIIKKHLSVSDTIILASDGIVDSFKDVEEYKNYINDMKLLNLQKFVDDIVFDASFQNKKHPDDMTIIAINMLKNY